MQTIIKKLLVAITILPSFSMAQDVYVVKGKVASLKPGEWVYMTGNNDGKPFKDSVKSENKTFQFKGKVFEPEQASLSTKKEYHGKRLYLEKGVINFNSNSDFDNAIIKGGSVNTEITAYRDAFKQYSLKTEELTNRVKKASEKEKKSPGFLNKLNIDSKNLADNIALGNKKFMKEHPNSYIPVINLADFPLTEKTYDTITVMYEELSPAQKATRKAKRAYAALMAVKNSTVGGMAPDFTMTDAEGNEVKMSSFRGKYLLLDFWASWCGPCRAENPNVRLAYMKYKDKNFTILGVSLDDEKQKDDWIAAMHMDNLPWTQVSDLKGWDSKAAQLYDIKSIPSNFLIDPQGKIIEKNLRGDKLHEALAKYIK